MRAIHQTCPCPAVVAADLAYDAHRLGWRHACGGFLAGYDHRLAVLTAPAPPPPPPPAPVATVPKRRRRDDVRNTPMPRETRDVTRLKRLWVVARIRRVPVGFTLQAVDTMTPHDVRVQLERLDALLFPPQRIKLHLYVRRPPCDVP